MSAQKQQLQCNPLQKKPHPKIHSPLQFSCSCPEKMSYYVSEHAAWADKIFRRFVNLRMDYQKLEHQRDPSQPLTARQQWKLKDLAYLKSFCKQRSARGAAGRTSRTSMEHDSDEEADERGHESSASSRKEMPTKIPVLNLPMPSRRPKCYWQYNINPSS